MYTKETIEKEMKEAVIKVKQSNPLAGSITNTVTINLVANAQLAVGGSAAMVYLPDEGECLAAAGGAFYINVGTLLPVYADALPRTAHMLHAQGKPWVLDPVGIGIGSLRTRLLQGFKAEKPSIIRGNASEIIALSNLWGLESGQSADGVRGVDATDPVDAARQAAVSLACWTGGAVAVSGEHDLITDGKYTVFSYGGSSFMEKITGAGCSLGGVAAVYATVASPFIAACTAAAVYNLAGRQAEGCCSGPGSFQVAFLDALYQAEAVDIAQNPLKLEEEKA